MTVKTFLDTIKIGLVGFNDGQKRGFYTGKISDEILAKVHANDKKSVARQPKAKKSAVKPVQKQQPTRNLANVSMVSFDQLFDEVKTHGSFAFSQSTVDDIVYQLNNVGFNVIADMNNDTLVLTDDTFVVTMDVTGQNTTAKLFGLVVNEQPVWTGNDIYAQIAQSAKSTR